MEHSNSKEKDVIIDLESGNASHEAHVKRDPNSVSKWGKMMKFVGGILGFNLSSNCEPIPGGSVECPNEMMELLEDMNPGGQKSHVLVPVKKDNEKERKKVGKVKKAPKPPRPPRGPSLDAADMRLVKEISKLAMKKRERIERAKALKKMKAAKLSSPSSSSGSTISAMIITVLFFLVLIFQGLGSSTSSNFTLSEAPQPAPETTGLTPVQFYETVLSDDGAAPSFVPPKSAE